MWDNGQECCSDKVLMDVSNTASEKIQTDEDNVGSFTRFFYLEEALEIKESIGIKECSMTQFLAKR